MKDKTIIVNSHSNGSSKVIKYLEEKKIKYHLADSLNKIIKKGKRDFIICGGDGTLHNFVNLIMKLSDKERDSISFGVIPCGRANDFARHMKIPLDIELAFKKIEENKIKSIDLIKVNNSYIITGGGIGLPSETVQEVDHFSSSLIGKHLKKPLGDFIYLLFTLKKFIFGYNGIEIRSKNKLEKLLAVYILNQPFIGKRFLLAPKAKNNDSLMEITIVKSPPTFMSRFKTLSKGTKGLLSDLEWVNEKQENTFYIQLSQNSSFMGDGEMLKPSKNYKIEVIPKVLNVFT